MKLTYEQIREIYFHKTNQWKIIDLVEQKYGIKRDTNNKCLYCGKRVETSGWLCVDTFNDHTCIIEFFNANHDLLVEVITHEA